MSERKPYTVNAVDDETGKRNGRTLTVFPCERVGHRDLVRIQASDPDSCEWGGVAYLPVGPAADFGHAIVNAASGEPLDDGCEPWDRGRPMPGGAWLDGVKEALVSPRATSRGHKSTIYAARFLVTGIEERDREIERLRAGVRAVADMLDAAEDARDAVLDSRADLRALIGGAP